jgi:uncharacterized protein
MHPLLESKREEIEALCRCYQVKRLYLFGSAARGDFKEASSDLDFVVEMGGRAPTGEYAERYLAFAGELEDICARPIDIVTESSIRNPYFRREVERTRQILYERPSEETTV